jgi:hypothetical protein
VGEKWILPVGVTALSCRGFTDADLGIAIANPDARPFDSPSE